jgi:hypothetical protein
LVDTASEEAHARKEEKTHESSRAHRANLVFEVCMMRSLTKPFCTHSTPAIMTASSTGETLEELKHEISYTKQSYMVAI